MRNNEVIPTSEMSVQQSDLVSQAKVEGKKKNVTRYTNA